MLGLPESVALNNRKLKIHSPEGMVDFLGINKITKNSYIHLKFSNGSELKCSEDHPISTINGIVKAKDLDKTTEIHCISGGCFVVSKRNINKKIDLYDIVNSGTKHLYYSNDVVSHNCEFLGSSATLVSGSKLRTLAFHDPMYTTDNFDVFEEPKEGHLYIATVDCSEGVGRDYSTINVVDVTQLPYKQVAKYRNNNLPLLFLPTIIYSVANKYNEAFVLVETNNVGQQVIDILHYELEYDNIFKSEAHHVKGQTISPGFKRQSTIGIKTTKSVKKIGCANLKTLIEGDKLIINDFETIAELNTFVRVRDSFAAEEGNFDDLVMGLVLFSWLASQSYFRDSTSMDVRKVLLEENLNSLEESLSPIGIFSDGTEPEVLDDGRDVWMENQFFLSNF
jgi:hypothetical protein